MMLSASCVMDGYLPLWKEFNAFCETRHNSVCHLLPEGSAVAVKNHRLINQIFQCSVSFVLSCGCTSDFGAVEKAWCLSCFRSVFTSRNLLL